MTPLKKLRTRARKKPKQKPKQRLKRKPQRQKPQRKLKRQKLRRPKSRPQRKLRWPRKRLKKTLRWPRRKLNRRKKRKKVNGGRSGKKRIQNKKVIKYQSVNIRNARKGTGLGDNTVKVCPLFFIRSFLMRGDIYLSRGYIYG